MSSLQQHIMTNREFIALVRAKLDARGHSDVAVERSWINEGEPGEPWLLNVPVGTELQVPLRPNAGFFNKPADECDFHIDYFAQALINLRRGEKSLVNYARQVRRAASECVAAARAGGLDLTLRNVGFASVYAAHLSGTDWKDAAMCVIGVVEVGCLTFFLRPGSRQISVDYPENITDEMSTVIDDQRERQHRLAELDGQGYDLEVDRITLDLLAAQGLQAQDVLRDVWKRQCVNFPLQDCGGDASLAVSSSDGLATATLVLDDIVWNGEHLWFRDRERATGHDGLVGGCLGDLVTHPALANRPVVKVERSHAGQGVDLIYFDLSEKVRFDADTGLIRPV